MIEIIILIITSFLFVSVLIIIIQGVIRKQPILGKPTVTPFLFFTGKLSALCNIFFLLLKGLKVNINLLFNPTLFLQYFGLVFLITGTVFASLASSILKDDLIFGLPKTEKHNLRTSGVYRISRHPFNFGFLMVLASSVMIVPNLINFIFFIAAWGIHHFIMINEEEFLQRKYGEEYLSYKGKVKRYLTIFK